MVPNEQVKKLRAFHGDKKIKTEFVKRVEAHRKADRIEKGHYWKDGKGCAVGCTLELNNTNDNIHAQYESQLGIPESLARLEDYLFETMPNDKAMKWPGEFLKAIPVGADLSLIAPKFIVAVLKDVVKLKYVKDDKQVVEAVLDVAALWARIIAGKEVKQDEWSAARSAAESAARSAARSAAWSAAESAAWSAAAYKMSRTIIKLFNKAK